MNSFINNLPFIRRYIIIPLVMIFFLIPPTFLGGCKLKACEKEPEQTGIIEADRIYFGSPNDPLNLVMWYVYEDPKVMETLASQYKAIHPHVTITTIPYRPFSEYISQLGLKSGTKQAPDIFFIRHDWLPLYSAKLTPMPEKLFRREPDKTETAEGYTDLFFPALKNDFLINKIETNPSTGEERETAELYGVPWGFEGLSLFINLDHFNTYNKANPSSRMNIPLPNETMTWTDFAAAAQKLIKTTNGWLEPSPLPIIDINTVEHFGAAIGNATNVQHEVDIFTTMLMQNNVKITGEDRKTVEFIKGQNTTAAVNALKDYTSFDRTWSDAWLSSMEAFAHNKVSMAFGRSFQLQSILNNRSLNFEVVPFPQRNATDPNAWVTPSFYWARVVNKSSEYPDVAWDFIKFVATADIMKVYNETTKIPPARQDLIGKTNLGSEKYDIFNQALPYTQSWYKGNHEDAEAVFKKAIQDQLRGVDSQKALTEAAKNLEDIINKHQIELE